jgi:NTP pyrophosphatase (non-canonical NTP hydrolase)
MKANEYQEWSEKTAIYPKDEGLVYVALGLAGEAGEVANIVKKMIRDDNGFLLQEKHDKLVAEMGDVMWYMARMCAELGTTLEDVMQQNHDKLEDRLARNVIQGSGDNR